MSDDRQLAAWPGRRAEAWLDDRGQGAWIAAMVLGFIFFWPVGPCPSGLHDLEQTHVRPRSAGRGGHAHHVPRPCAPRTAFSTSGNTAFDAYKADTLAGWRTSRRRSRPSCSACARAKDKAEFDQYLAGRAAAAAGEAAADAGETNSGGMAGRSGPGGGDTAPGTGKDQS